jgi:hypothetical protein
MKWPNQNNHTFALNSGMKKAFVAILALLYISTATGATIHMHYCMGKLVEWGLWPNRSKQCGRCGMEKLTQDDNGCCKDEQKLIKIDKDHKITINTIQVLQFSAAAVTTDFNSSDKYFVSTLLAEFPVSHAPPRSFEIPVYLLHCVFRI